jgi:iron complex outermembrane receptor protein
MATFSLSFPFPRSHFHGLLLGFPHAIRRRLRLPLFCAFIALLSGPALAEDPGNASATVIITGSPTSAVADVAGFGDTPLSRAPLQASVVPLSQIQGSGGVGLSALTRFDASVSDAYNADGYWTSFNVRGFAIDNRYNFMRDGLPINAETSLPLDNKSSIEVLKGTSGIQAGTSAPGGLVNLEVKRPEGNQRQAGLSLRESGSLGAWADLSQRFGPKDAFGLRLNVAAEHLDPQVRDDKGSRNLVALAGDWRVNAQTLIEAELESSQQSQPSVPGFSLLGSQLPSAKRVDPRINLNNQPWSLPVVLEGSTGSLRLTQRLTPQWKLVAHALRQSLHSDDRLAYSFGCSKEGNYDRYCSDGTFDEYDYRSDGERRITDDLDLHAEGQAQTGAITHHLVFGALATRFRLRTQPQADDSVIVGSGTVDGLTIVPTLPADLGVLPNTDRTERSDELYLRDHAQLGRDIGLWVGLRHTRLNRASVQTDGTEATSYSQAFTTPWLALSRAWASGRLFYASWGQGIESTVAPNRPGYTNPGQPLPAIKSRQFELGFKQTGEQLSWGVDWFDIQQPQYDDVTAGCDANGDPCTTTQLDGTQHNRGLEMNLHWAAGPWRLLASAMALRSQISGNSDPAIDGKRPTNVPGQTVKLNGSYELAAWPGLKLQAGMVYEGARMVLPDNSLEIPGWTRWDLGLGRTTNWRSTRITWALGLDNATNRRAWRESPYEYQHVYLFPLAPTTWRASVQAEL